MMPCCFPCKTVDQDMAPAKCYPDVDDVHNVGHPAADHPDDSGDVAEPPDDVIEPPAHVTDRHGDVEAHQVQESEQEPVKEKEEINEEKEKKDEEVKPDQYRQIIGRTKEGMHIRVMWYPTELNHVSVPA